MYCYSNNGLSMRAVADDYVPQNGEQVFPTTQTVQQLSAAFSGYTAAVSVLTHASLKISAQTALDKSDVTVVRCYSAAVAVPTAWQTYRSALRAIVNGGDTTSTSLPTVPSYPQGT